MGADLYINKIHKECQTKYSPIFDAAVKLRDSLPKDSLAADRAQGEVEKAYDLLYSEGYFRDSYNESSLLWTLGLSWWQDVPKFLNKRSNLTPQKALELASLIDPLPFMQLPKPHGQETAADVLKYFVEKKARFLAFLRLAAKKKLVIRASI